MPSGVVRLSDLYGGTSTAQQTGGASAPTPAGDQAMSVASSAFTAKNVVLAWIVLVLIQVFLRLMFDAAERVV
jgi:hypothetical protein